VISAVFVIQQQSVLFCSVTLSLYTSVYFISVVIWFISYYYFFVYFIFVPETIQLMEPEAVCLQFVRPSLRAFVSCSFSVFSSIIHTFSVVAICCMCVNGVITLYTVTQKIGANFLFCHLFFMLDRN